VHTLPSHLADALQENVISGESQQLISWSTNKRATEQVRSEDVMAFGASTDFRVRKPRL